MSKPKNIEAPCTDHIPAILHRSGGPDANVYNTCGVCGRDIERIAGPVGLVWILRDWRRDNREMSS